MKSNKYTHHKVLEDTNYILLTESNTLCITMCWDSRSNLFSSLLRLQHTTATMATTSPTATSINTVLTTTAITMVTSCDGMLAVVLGGGVRVEAASIGVSG